MPGSPLAYHITFATYGTRLHGDERGTVDRDHNCPGEPILDTDAPRENFEASLMRFPSITFTEVQRRFVEVHLASICERGGWGYRIASAGEDHVHGLIAADAHGSVVRRLLKRWLGQALFERWPMSKGRTWWAEGGSVKWVWEEQYLRRAYDYIADQRITER